MSQTQEELYSINGSGKIGAVMVVGGGIAAMQSALDMADSGFKVYMLTNDPCIGGNMVRLDKTFPTNDCSMCIVSPKLVTVGNHPNIQIVTMSDVQKFEGEPGRFKVTALKRARFIDESKCTGCAECEAVCPVRLPNKQNEGMDERRAAYRMYPQAVPNWYAIDRKSTSPCKSACPANISCQGYVNLVAEGRFRDALDCIRDRIPFPSVCGRVCYHPCEDKCNRGLVDEPVAINGLKRFVADLELEEAGVISKTSGIDRSEDSSKLPGKDKQTEITMKAEKVAVIGAGPAGLTAAHDLALLGFPVTVFEKLPVAGGMLAVGIPEYRLPKKVLDYEIKRIMDLGVDIKLNAPVNKDNGLDKLFEQGYKAVFIGVGAHGSMKLDVNGEDIPGVMSGVDFLRKVKLNESTGIGKNIAIVGGGNVAIDAARTAVRLGVEKVTVVYRRTRDEMPAHGWEIHEAEKEGIEFKYLVSPVEIMAGTDGRVAAIRCIKNELGEPDDSGRRRPVAVKGSEFDINADTVIAAIGQKPVVDFLNEDCVGVSKWGTVVADKKTLATQREGVFAGGDCVTGADMAITAISAGKNAAVSIARYLSGESLDSSRYEDELSESVPLGAEQIDATEKSPRNKPSSIPVSQRKGGFSEVEMAFTSEQAIAEARRCMNCGPCADCRMCEKVCQQNCVDFKQKDEVVEFEIGSVVLAPGFETFNPALTTQYGYGVYSNVYTSIEFERLLSASGPTMGHIARRSDHREPRNVAFIQCVGSRDASIGREYCSAVCCMYTAKESIIAKEHQPNLDCTVFCIDVRAHGKNFDRYYETAKNTYGVKYVRGVISGIKELQQSNNLLLTYLDENGKQKTEEFDMVVLAVGLQPTSTNKQLAEIFNIKLNEYGFCETDGLNTVKTSREGVFAAGAFNGPKDIPDSVTQAGSAACEAVMNLSSERGSCISPMEYPPERNVTAEAPKIGVVICRCGFNIGSVVDVPKVVDFAKTLPNVVFAEESLYSCSQDSIDHIVDVIKKHDLNRFVISSCTVRTHLPLFEQAMKRAGLNKYLFEMANIREQDSWVHRDRPGMATDKAMDLVAGAVAKVAAHKPLEIFRSEVVRKALVIGGGPSGMTAALAIAEQGHEVFLIEKEAALGGNLRNIHYLLGADPQKLLLDMVSKVEAHPMISVFKQHAIESVSGHVGNFTTKLSATGNGNGSGIGHVELNHGVTVVATGGVEVKPELKIGNRPEILTQSEFEEKIAANDPLVKNAKNIVMIQCHGQRNEEHPYCSKICCQSAIKNIIKLKDINPDSNAYVLYRDMRSYGFKELKFLEARDKGAIFIRFKDGEEPAILLSGNRVRVSVRDDVIKREFVFEPDVLVLSVAVEPSETGQAVSEALKVPIDEDGFFCEAHAKLRPVEFASEGIFLCGVAHSPKPIEENIAQAKAAASRAMTILSKEFIEASGMVAHVNKDICAACLTCVRVCPFGVPFVNDENRAEINSVECQGCGCCAGACPAKAIEVEHFRDEQVLAAEDAIIMSAISNALARK